MSIFLPSKSFYVVLTCPETSISNLCEPKPKMNQNIQYSSFRGGKNRKLRTFCSIGARSLDSSRVMKITLNYCSHSTQPCVCMVWQRPMNGSCKASWCVILCWNILTLKFWNLLFLDVVQLNLTNFEKKYPFILHILPLHATCRGIISQSLLSLINTKLLFRGNRYSKFEFLLKKDKTSRFHVWHRHVFRFEYTPLKNFKI